MIELGVNVDHVATVRQARRTYEPDPVWAAVEAHLGGADGITVHLREDRRHIQDEDVRRLRELTHIKLNLEMAATDEMVSAAQGIRPEMAMLVPEGRHEITTEGGLDVAGQEGRLREDLYFRINTLMLPVPALRERPTDIPLLAEFFLRKYANQHGKAVTSYHPDALRALVNFSWPGNVRELQHVVERAVILTQGGPIELDDLPDNLTAAAVKQ